MSDIHPSAIVDPNSSLGEGVKIGPYCVVGADVKLSDSVILKSHVVVDGHTTIGEGTEIHPFSSIGSPPQDLKFDGEISELIIGKNNRIREHVTMNPGTKGGGLKTVVGDNGLFMPGSHVAHDCMLGNNIIMANNATLAGHVVVGDFAILGGLSAVHQFVRIGEHAMVGGMSGVENDVIPYGSVMGERARLNGLNVIGLKRRGFSKDDIHSLRKAYKMLFAEQGTQAERIAEIADQYSDHPVVSDMVSFVSADSQRGLTQHRSSE